jgi:hypothetical protein
MGCCLFRRVDCVTASWEFLNEEVVWLLHVHIYTSGNTLFVSSRAIHQNPPIVGCEVRVMVDPDHCQAKKR